MVDQRYARQALFRGVGAVGQERLAGAVVIIVGLGSLGSLVADLLARAGVGRIRLVDRDFVDESNLCRQTLYDEGDARQALPKAVAAKKRLERINFGVSYEAFVTDLRPANVEELVRGSDAVVDGTDNFETRFLLNETSVKLGVPWVYGACAGSQGLTFTIRPGSGPCFRCFIADSPVPGTALTCETAGILGPAAAAIASLQAAQALFILTGAADQVAGHLPGECGPDATTLKLIDVWSDSLETMVLRRDPDCPCCAGHSFPFLDSRAGTQTTILCGRDMVQVTPRVPGQVSLAEVARRLGQVGQVTVTEFLVRASLDGLEMVIFPDGRALFKGTSSPEAARSLYARYLGV